MEESRKKKITQYGQSSQNLSNQNLPNQMANRNSGEKPVKNLVNSYEGYKKNDFTKSFEMEARKFPIEK